MKKQSKLMTFLDVTSVGIYACSSGKCSSTQAAGQGDMLYILLMLARDWQSSSSQEEKIFFMMVEIGRHAMKWYSI